MSKRSCTVRGICDSKEHGEEFIHAEKHLCAECRPDGWIILTAHSVDQTQDEVNIHLRTTGARAFGEALIQIADAIEARGE